MTLRLFLVGWFGMAFITLSMLSMGMPVWLAIVAELSFFAWFACRLLRQVCLKRWQYRVCWYGQRQRFYRVHFFDTRIGAALCMRWLRWRGLFVRVNGERYL